MTGDGFVVHLRVEKLRPVFVCREDEGWDEVNQKRKLSEARKEGE